MTTYKISAYNEVTCQRMELFTWTRTPEAGIERAKRDAKNFQMDNILSDYRADPVDETAPDSSKPLFRQIADRTYADAYSGDRYGKSERATCAMMLLERGFSEAETEWVLMSKWMRWAGDMSNTTDAPTAGDLARFLDNPKCKATINTARNHMAND